MGDARSDPGGLLEPLLALHGRIRDGVVAAFEERAREELSAVAADDAGDTIYAVDRVGEELVVEGLAKVAESSPLRLVMEGLEGGSLVLPEGAGEDDIVWRVVVDPIDGTRGLMYQKRSAWVLTGVAPERGAATSLRDVVLAVQTEIPLLKQHLSDQLWAVRGQGVEARRNDRVGGTTAPITLRPSAAAGIEHGFVSVSRFFPGVRDVLAAIDDEVVLEVAGVPRPGAAVCFEDQYASTGGQLYELAAGHDRVVADVRAMLGRVYAERGLPPGLACHPYDICTALIAEELGVVVTDGAGRPLDPPLDLDTDVAWAGYANERLRRAVEPALRAALVRHGLLDPGQVGGGSGPVGGEPRAAGGESP